jgi:chaperonin cofactor prefoldin
MKNLSGNCRALSNFAFVGVVLALIIACVLIGFVGFTGINNLQSEKNLLNSQVTSLQASIGQLQTNYQDLQTNYQNLQSNFNQLQTSNNQLNDSYAQLNSQYQTLNSQYQTLNSQYQALLSRLPTSQGIAIDSVYSRSGWAYGVYNVTIRNLGTTDVHVTSLKLYHGTSLVSSASVLVAIPASSTATINQFLQWDMAAAIGYLPTHILRVETLEGYNATSDPLSSG